MSLAPAWPVQFVIRIASEICSGLQAAHEHTNDDGTRAPIVHRDISPHNVLVSTAGSVKLTDFGIAKSVDSTDHTQPGTFRGKAAYASPEQIRGEPADPASDIYS